MSETRVAPHQLSFLKNHQISGTPDKQKNQAKYQHLDSIGSKNFHYQHMYMFSNFMWHNSACLSTYLGPQLLRLANSPITLDAQSQQHKPQSMRELNFNQMPAQLLSQLFKLYDYVIHRKIIPCFGIDLDYFTLLFRP